MRSLTQVLKQESPISLAREFVWRVQKKRDQKQFLSTIEADECPVTFRNIPYYKPQRNDFSEASRALITAFADEISEGRYPFLGYGTVELGKRPRWNLDWVSGLDWPTNVAVENRECMRFDGSDIKAPYELSRLQFLPVLGKAFVLTGEEFYRDSAKELLSFWLEQNPVGLGINWSIAMEAALRGMSICFLLNLIAPFQEHEEHWINAVTKSLWQHMRYIETHIEFSHIIRSNHYLSNIVGLYCLSSFLEGEGMAAKREYYRKKVEAEILLQTYEDGGDYEASTGYQMLVTQMFTSVLLLTRANGVKPDARFMERLRLMHRVLHELASPSGQLPHLGDCDDGRVELLLDDLKQMLLTPLAERNSLRLSGFLGLGKSLFGDGKEVDSDCALEESKWFDLRSPAKALPAHTIGSSAIFKRSGVAVLRGGPAKLIFFAVPNGIGGKGSHNHNDKLSFVLQLDGEEVLIDSGTGTYTRDPELRNLFRLTSAHNTVAVDNKEQNNILPGWQGLFTLGGEAEVSGISITESNGVPAVWAEHKGYGSQGVNHARSMALDSKASILMIEDHLKGYRNHTFELFFQLAPKWKVVECEAENHIARARVSGPRDLTFEVTAPASIRVARLDSRISMTYGFTQPGERLRFSGEATFPATVSTKICWAN